LDFGARVPAHEPDAEKCILIVDDDVDIRETIRDVLEDEGYRVIVASDGANALGLLRRGVVPRLILLDLMMPVMNGWEFREELQRDPALSAIPIVVLTGDGSAAAKAEALHAASYVRKPVDLEPLLACIARLCSGPA
jgi:CheY-like chemotaxis protein